MVYNVAGGLREQARSAARQECHLLAGAFAMLASQTRTADALMAGLSARDATLGYGTMIFKPIKRSPAE